MAILEMGQSTVSKHLGILKNAGLVEVRKESTWSFYNLSKDGTDTYRNFIRLVSLVLNDDALIREDGERFREVIKKDMKIICSTGKGK